MCVCGVCVCIREGLIQWQISFRFIWKYITLNCAGTRAILFLKEALNFCTGRMQKDGRKEGKGKERVREKINRLCFYSSGYYFHFTIRQIEMKKQKKKKKKWSQQKNPTDINFHFVEFRVTHLQARLKLLSLMCLACLDQGIEPRPSAVEAQSPNNWTTRKFPRHSW